MSVAWVGAGIAAVGVLGNMSAADSAADAAGNATAAAQQSASDSTALGREQLDFTKQQYADAKPARDKAVATAQEIAEAQLASQTQNDALASDYANYNKTTFRPLEQGIVASAQGYDTPEKRQAAADSSIADVNAGIASQRAGSARALAANGINPGSARAMAVQAGTDVDAARAGASAAYTARKGVETTGFARQMDAASLGRNLPSSQATSAGLALTAGNSAVNNAVNGVNAGNAGVAGVQAGYQGAVSATTASGQLYNSAAGIAANAASQQAATWGSLGSVAGRFIGSNTYSTGGGSSTNTNPSSLYAQNGSDVGFYVSDENVKEDIAPADAEQALTEVRGTPVKKWRYSPAKMAAKGIAMDDGAEHTGPMAQDVNATMGERAAPGGTRIDPITLTGKAMLGIQAVAKRSDATDRRVQALTKKVGALAAMIGSGQIQARATA